LTSSELGRTLAGRELTLFCGTGVEGGSIR
jgi:hypothetical protein